jgi:hypothetical protein
MQFEIANGNTFLSPSLSRRWLGSERGPFVSNTPQE